MSAIFNFNSLITTVQSYVERAGAANDPTAYAFIPTAINLTEQKIARELKIQGLIRVVDWTMQTNTSAYQKPDRWRENISMQIGTSSTATAVGQNWSPVYTRDYEYCRAYWPNATQVGTPKYYSDMDYDHWWVSPTPQAAYPVQTLYWELPAPLASSNQSNWLSNYAPNALLHGTLTEMYGFLKNTTERQTWSQEYDRDMAGLSGEELQKILDRMEARSSA